MLERIAACESGGDPAAISADGRYRGKYQFSRATWRAMGGTGDPADAPESEQDACAAALLEAARHRPPGPTAPERRPLTPAGGSRRRIAPRARSRSTTSPRCVTSELAVRHERARGVADGLHQRPEVLVARQRARRVARADRLARVALREEPEDRGLDLRAGHRHRSRSGASRIRSVRAGAPATTALSGTSLVTTVFVPTMQLSPTVTPRRMQAP